MASSGGPRTYKAPPTLVAANNASFSTFIPGLAWDQQPFFQALTRVRGPPGSKNTYDEPRPQGFHGGQDRTAFIFGQVEVTEYHWPDIMYMLRPPEEREEYLRATRPPNLTDQFGWIMYEKWPVEGRGLRPLRLLPGLPDTVGTPIDSCRHKAYVIRYRPMKRGTGLKCGVGSTPAFSWRIFSCGCSQTSTCELLLETLASGIP